MDEIHVHKTKKSICAHFAESPCNSTPIQIRCERWLIVTLDRHTD